jgi:hypothetical protein
MKRSSLLAYLFQNLVLRVTFDPTSETEEFEWTDDKILRLTFNLVSIS